MQCSKYQAPSTKKQVLVLVQSIHLQCDHGEEDEDGRQLFIIFFVQEVLKRSQGLGWIPDWVDLFALLVYLSRIARLP